MGNNRKKIDNRIRLLIENGVAQGRRSMFVVVGDKARDQVVSVLLSICSVLTVIILPGRCPPSHVVQGYREGETQRSLVLQKRAGLQQSQEEENETAKQEDKSWQDGD